MHKKIYIIVFFFVFYFVQIYFSLMNAIYKVKKTMWVFLYRRYNKNANFLFLKSVIAASPFKKMQTLRCKKAVQFIFMPMAAITYLSLQQNPYVVKLLYYTILLKRCKSSFHYYVYLKSSKIFVVEKENGSF